MLSYLLSMKNVRVDFGKVFCVLRAKMAVTTIDLLEQMC